MKARGWRGGISVIAVRLPFTELSAWNDELNMNWEQKFVRFVAERWVFQKSDPHAFRPRTLLLAFGEDFISPLLEKHKHFGTFYSGYVGGRLIGYVRVPPGTVILEGVMRSLPLTRVDTIIGLGTCGALQSDIDCGDIIIADAAQAGECLSAHYGFEFGQMIAADPGLSGSLTGFLRRQGKKVFQGPIVTTGAVFRETDELLRSWNKAGFLGVELEAASMFALANYLGVKSTMALMVTDNPVRNETSEVLRSPKREAFIAGITGFVGSPNIPA